MISGADVGVLALVLAGAATLVLAVKDFIAELRPTFRASRTDLHANFK
jgi:hypothetical protein